MNRQQAKNKFYIQGGNYSHIVKDCMLLREDQWEETHSFDKLFNFKWQPWARGLQFGSVNSFGTRQIVNHLQNHNLLSTKHLLFENLALYCEAKKQNVFRTVPLTFTLETEH